MTCAGSQERRMIDTRAEEEHRSFLTFHAELIDCSSCRLTCAYKETGEFTQGIRSRCLMDAMMNGAANERSFGALHRRNVAADRCVCSLTSQRVFSAIPMLLRTSSSAAPRRSQKRLIRKALDADMEAAMKTDSINSLRMWGVNIVVRSLGNVSPQSQGRNKFNNHHEAAILRAKWKPVVYYAYKCSDGIGVNPLFYTCRWNELGTLDRKRGIIVNKRRVQLGLQTNFTHKPNTHSDMRRRAVKTTPYPPSNQHIFYDMWVGISNSIIIKSQDYSITQHLPWQNIVQPFRSQTLHRLAYLYFEEIRLPAGFC